MVRERAGGEEAERIGRRGNCVWDVMFERRIDFNNKKEKRMVLGCRL